jgi:hypothetical protein
LMLYSLCYSISIYQVVSLIKWLWMQRALSSGLWHCVLKQKYVSILKEFTASSCFELREGEGKKFLQNVGACLSKYVASHCHHENLIYHILKLWFSKVWISRIFGVSSFHIVDYYLKFFEGNSVVWVHVRINMMTFEAN